VHTDIKFNDAGSSLEYMTSSERKAAWCKHTILLGLPSLQTLFALPLQNLAYYFNLLYLIFSKLVKLSKTDGRGSVHHSKIHKEKFNNMQQYI
jgi:hypothetical protein